MGARERMGAREKRGSPADLPRICAGVLAALGWTALGIELTFTITGALAKGAPLAPALLRYVSFFTIQTNFFLALLMTAAWLRPGGGGMLMRPAVQGAAVVYIIIVGVVYALLLQHLFHPQGLLFVAERLFHLVLPVLYPLYWLVFIEKGRIRWAHPLIWLIFPFLYFNYILLRGAISGVYPYHFLDVAKHGYGQIALNGLGLLAAFLVVGLVVAAVDKALAAHKSRSGRQLGRAADF